MERSDRNNRNILVFLIAAAIAVAVFASFGLPLFAAPTPTITLPTPLPTGQQEEGGESGGAVRVDIRPDTVQNVISAMDRPGSYFRTVTTTLNGVSTTGQVWVDGGWTRSVLTLPGGREVHTLIGEGTVWRWYFGDREAASWPAEEGAEDLESQRIPTYEDVLALDPDTITAAGYEDKNGVSCVYVEAAYPALDQTERYWIASDSGLLWAAETLAGGETVWSMTSAAPELPVPTGVEFALPDGRVLHTTGE